MFELSLGVRIIVERDTRTGFTILKDAFQAVWVENKRV